MPMHSRIMPRRLMPMRLGRSALISLPHAICRIQCYAEKSKQKLNRLPPNTLRQRPVRSIPVG
eukprot:3124394-Amphidinium_carterae.1